MSIKKLILASALLFALPLSAKDYSGAELFTNSTYMYGRFEARMMMASGSGIVSSMFAYYNDSYKGSPEPWVEIDIEILGKAPAKFQSNIITGNAAAKVTSEKMHTLSPAADAGYHTYAIEWTPEYVAWFVDDALVRCTKTDSSDTKKQVAALIKEQSLRFNLWSSETASWVGTWNDAILPVHQYISWVKAYTYDKASKTFTLAWVDDFNTFDDSRWGTGNWTFDGNRVDMSPDNVTVKDGALVLSLTKVGAEGFTGSVPADPKGSSAIKTPRSRAPSLSLDKVKTFDLLGRYQGTVIHQAE